MDCANAYIWRILVVAWSFSSDDQNVAQDVLVICYTPINAANQNGHHKPDINAPNNEIYSATLLALISENINPPILIQPHGANTDKNKPKGIKIYMPQI